MNRSKLPYFFLALAAVLALAALVLLFIRPGTPRVVEQPPPPVVVEEEKPAPTPELPPAVPNLAEMPVPETPEQVLENLGVGANDANPADLVARIAKAIEAGDLATAAKLIGKDALDPSTLERLKNLASAQTIKLRKPGGVREVGELEIGNLARWALELDGPEAGRDRIFLDLRKKQDKWSVERLTLPPAMDEPIPKAIIADSLGTADAFLQAVLKQDFEFARAFVDPATVSDAKIAGLCILFEEGGYKLRESKPLRALFQRNETVGYLANVETTDASQSAQFSLTLRQPPAPANWLVSEINLDELLADYAKRVAGGDVYYSPLVKNPQGGDTLALYFEFDEDDINPRTRRQLEIVSLILKSDPGKKITLSGHTDALGTEQYNQSLSVRRATVVKSYLISAGVSESQIITVAKGASQPRRPNVTESGDDDPDGRRANRRTEIYLDF
jgi:OOP family OmpA-OmpF porin